MSPWREAPCSSLTAEYDDIASQILDSIQTKINLNYTEILTVLRHISWQLDALISVESEGYIGW